MRAVTSFICTNYTARFWFCWLRRTQLWFVHSFLYIRMPSGKGGLTCPWLSWWEASSVIPYVFLNFLGLNLSILSSQVSLQAVPTVSYLSSQVCVWEDEDLCQEYRLMPVPNTNPSLSDSGEILEVTIRITQSSHMEFLSKKICNWSIHTILRERWLVWTEFLVYVAVHE